MLIPVLVLLLVVVDKIPELVSKNGRCQSLTGIARAAIRPTPQSPSASALPRAPQSKSRTVPRCVHSDFSRMNLRIQIFAAPGDGLGCRTGDPLTQGRPLRPAVTRELDLTGVDGGRLRGCGGGPRRPGWNRTVMCAGRAALAAAFAAAAASVASALDNGLALTPPMVGFPPVAARGPFIHRQYCTLEHQFVSPPCG